MVQELPHHKTGTSELREGASIDPVRRYGNRRGAALVEIALAIPILLLVLAMIGDFSRAYVVAKAVDNSISMAAYQASTTPITLGQFSSWSSTIEQRLRDSLDVYAWYESNRLIVRITQPSVSNGLIDSSGNVLVEIQTEYSADHLIRLPSLPSSYTIFRTIRVDKVR